MSSGRSAALTVLEKCRRADAWSDAVLGSVLDAAGLDARERGFATALCYGVLQQRMYLDHCISAYCSLKLSKLEPKVLDILRLTAYQILFMERVPVSAAVNEAVKLTRSLGYGRAAGMVNAVCRKISENKAVPPPVIGSAAQQLSVQYSHPLWLVELYLSRLGAEEAGQLLKLQNEPPPACLQVNTGKVSTEELASRFAESHIAYTPHPYLRDCLCCQSAGSVEAFPGFAEGFFFVQDAAAFMAVMAAGIQPETEVLDLCAAPGGKSFAAAILGQGRVSVTACDLHENKLSRIRSGAKRLGFEKMTLLANDARIFRQDWENRFDTVICDVPCSGLGVIRKKPDIRYKDPGDFAGLSAVQSAILQTASRYVKPGGILLYSTCTIRQEENETIVNSFLSENCPFSPEDFSLCGDICSRGGMFTFWPQKNGTDGFFVAKMRKLSKETEQL